MVDTIRERQRTLTYLGYQCSQDFLLIENPNTKKGFQLLIFNVTYKTQTPFLSQLMGGSTFKYVCI